MAQLITIVGATGIQGGSVVRALLGKAEYKLRGITRNKNSEAAKALSAQGVEVVEADLNDLESLKRAFAGSYAIFAVTNFFEALPIQGLEKAMKIETHLGTNLAKAAAATGGLEHYIWSTLPNSRKNTGGKLVVPYYESKNQVDGYIRTKPELLKKSTFLWIPWYAQNIQYPFFLPFSIPNANPNIVFQLQTTPADVPWLSAGDVTVNVGLYVAATLAHPEKTRNGATVLAVSEETTPGKVVQAWATAQGKTGEILQVSKEMYEALWPGWTDLMHLSHSYQAVMNGKAFTGEDVILGKEDLRVEGLVGTEELYSKMHKAA